MLFELHKEGKVSFKRLSPAELKKTVSHQTHIGLTTDSLSFISDVEKMKYNAMLIYKDSCQMLGCEITKIQRKSGRRDSTKVSCGRNRSNNIVKRIREFARLSNKKFYLLWFGLSTETPVFFLIGEQSDDYKFLNRKCRLSQLKDKQIVTYSESDKYTKTILEYVESRMGDVSIDLQKDLENDVYENPPVARFNEKDIDCTRKHIQKIGKQGEFLINEYLRNLKADGRILDFEWLNSEGEKKQPYDFKLTTLDHTLLWIDVKTTDYDFNQKFFLSKNELNFINKKDGDSYAIYRVYSFKGNTGKLRVCRNCLGYMIKLLRDITYITDSMADYGTKISNYVFAVEPNDKCFKTISEEQLLTISE